ncbi:hypothetical protein HY844_02890 [Candidatus Berkelbacteria bacterium]|nr:hypothetical protein [Candidatus Berkelbacteria bacterium]
MQENIDISICDLYSQGKSAPQIANILNISQWSIYRTLKRREIPRRTTVYSNKLTFLSKPLSYSKLTRLNTKQNELFIAGLFIYLGEGSKKSFGVVDLANSDPQVISIFLRMLREIYQINEEKLRVYLYTHENRDVGKIISYWSKLLDIPKSQFTKPYIKSGLTSNHNDKMKNGLVHIRYADKRLWDNLMDDIRYAINNMLG